MKSRDDLASDGLAPPYEEHLAVSAIVNFEESVQAARNVCALQNWTCPPPWMASVTTILNARAGETVIANHRETFLGGSVANQAWPARKLGAAGRSAGCVGNDEFGRVARVTCARAAIHDPIRFAQACVALEVIRRGTRSAPGREEVEAWIDSAGIPHP